MKLLKALLLVTLFTGSCIFSGCSKNNDNPLDVVSDTLTLYKPLGSYGIYFDAAVAAYNKAYPNVKVTLREFGENSTDPNVMEQNANNLKDTLTTELAAGKGPDVIFWSYELSDTYKLMNSKIFDDLNKYIDEDKEFSLSNYQEEIMEAGIYDDKRYIFPLEYSVPLYMSTEEILKENNITKQMDISFEEYTRAVKDYAAKNDVTPFSSKGLGLDSFIPWSGLNLIDYNKFCINKDIIESDSFKNIMDIYQSYYTQDYSEIVYFGSSSDAEMLINKKALFTVPGIGEGGYNRSLLRGYSFISHDAAPVINSLKGYDGKVIAEVSTNAAIRANSNNKQNAWNFIKILLSPEENGIESSTTFFPVSKQGLKNKIDSQIEEIKKLDGESQSGDIYGTILNSEPIPEEFSEKYLSLITDVDSAVLQNTAIDDILKNTMEPYFKSEKTYEECIKDLENKLDMYIYE